MVIKSYGKADAGRVREVNEDRFLVDHSLGLLVVCDGMGGHQRGAVAAELAIEAIRFYTDASSNKHDVSWPFGYTFELSVDANRLVTAIRLANRQVWRRSEQSLECAGMGTTIAALLFSDNRVVFGNVGDSRIYLSRGGVLRQLSTDDTMVASMVQKGLLSPADAATHPMRNVVTQAAGAREQIDVHLGEESLSPGDTLLLCSDGVYGVVPESRIHSILLEEPDVETAVDKLVAAALSAGAPDNVSAVIGRVD